MEKKELEACASMRGGLGCYFAKCNLLQITDYLIEIVICDIIYIILSKWYKVITELSQDIHPNEECVA